MEQPAAATDPDDALVRSARDGDFAAFEQLVHKYEHRLYGLALRMLRNSADAQEVVQETFLSVVEHLRSFAGHSSFRTWLVRIATNNALRVLRKRRSSKTTPLTDPGQDSYADLPHPNYIAPWADDPTVIAERREARELIEQAVWELDEKYRVVFLLRDVEGLSTEETASALDISLANVKVRLLRARLMLRERLTEQFGDASRRMVPSHDHEEEHDAL